MGRNETTFNDTSKCEEELNQVRNMCKNRIGNSTETFEYCQYVATNVTNYECNVLPRFEDTNEYMRIGWVSMFHVILPFGLTVTVFLHLCVKKVIKMGWITPLKIPIPPIAKIYKTTLEVRNFWNNTKKQNAKEHEKKKEELMEELEEQNKLTNVSMLIEAGTESTFQFLLQSLFVLPTIILAMVNLSSLADLTELVDFKILSILLSFITFAWSSFNIRLENINYL